MKKIFTLIAATLMAVGASAATETIFNAADAGWGAAGVDLTTGTTTVGSVTWYGRGGAALEGSSKTFSDEVSWTKKLKFGGKSTFKDGKTLAGVFTFTPTKHGIVKVYCVGGGSGTRTTYISQSITTTENDATTAVGSFASNQDLGIAQGTVEANKMVYVWADNNVHIYGITFEETSAVAVDPVFSLSKASINTLQTSQIKVGEKAGLDGLTLSNLTYDNTVISIDESGKITPVAVGTSTITFTTAAVDGKYNAGTGNLSITVTSAVLDEQVNVTGSATWDWSKFGASEIKLSTTTSPAKDEEFVLSNIVNYGFCESINEGFGNAQQLKVACEYPVRGSQYLQGPTIKFTTTVAGTLDVTFSSTGNSNDRDLIVNSTVAGNAPNTTMVEAKGIAVAAGEVILKGVAHNAGADAAAAYLRYAKIVFTANTTAIQNVKAAAAENGVMFNLAGQKVGNDFKGIVVKDGKKVVIK